ncbi:uncharacterized protein LOC102801573 [Saccoglossus kowalevskii]|uniref:Uncharacterized protein LOC102801573 n=1 Tax=Saccoglossus kowalevskii TaxID=10224 RepID=A0ABM0MQ06_SACKO|nr:PREDICTED: uncharacterized protein LOC102801573 [Saccoglossus kowalevskii]
MNSVPSDIHAKDLQCLDLNQDMLPTQRSLGIQWSLHLDTFTYKVNFQEKPFSRRGVLAIVNSIYDPLGILAPVTIEGKRILRGLIAETSKVKEDTHVGWDDPLPEEYLPRWKCWRDSLVHLENVHIPRCYTPHAFGPVKRREYHIFCDASDVAIGAVAYLRQINDKDEVNVAFLLGKAKVNPTNAVSIPRLELCAAVLATQLAGKIKAEIRSPTNCTVYYTDSTIVLGYLNNEAKRFHVYVANRIQKIHNSSSPDQWCHIPTSQNPADLATRSVPAHQLSNTMWLKGPQLLWQPDHTPETNNGQQTYDISDEDPEVHKKSCVFATDIKKRKPSPDNPSGHLGSKRFLRFSSCTSLRRAVANLILKIQSYKTNCKEVTDVRLTPKILERAENHILRTVQKDAFPKELKKLSPTDTGGNELRKDSPLYRLNTFMDEDQLLRVGGRIRRADLKLSSCHPIVLPKNNHISQLIVEHVHQETQHQGRHLTLAAVRAKGYWILGLHNLVRSILHKCTTCRRLRAKPLTQVMADLPADRMANTPPFTNVGMDVFGPWNIVSRRTRGGASGVKRWAVIFVYTRQQYT